MPKSPDRSLLPTPRRLSTILLVAAALFALFSPRAGSAGRPELVTESRLLLGTVVTVTVSGVPEGSARSAAAAALDAMAAVDREMARNPGTALWELNRAGRGRVSADFAEVLASALIWARRTGGAFDPTVAPLLDLWNVQAAPHAPPSADAVRGALSRIGWGRVRLDAPSRTVDLGSTALDFGGIAKGFALDRAAEALRASGVKDFLIDAGGDVHVAGTKGGRRWRVGIQHPRDAGLLLRVVEPSEGVLLTSGDYQRGYEWKGERIHHLVDARTGQPARGMRSVTLWAPRAGAIPSAAVFVLGLADGLELAASVTGVEALVVDAAGRVQETAGFSRVAPTSGEFR